MAKIKTDPVTYTGRRSENPQLAIVNTKIASRTYKQLLLNKVFVDKLNGKSNINLSFKGKTRLTHITPTSSIQFAINNIKLVKLIEECVDFNPITEKLYVECTITGIKKPVVTLNTIIVQQRQVPVRRIKI